MLRLLSHQSQQCTSSLQCGYSIIALHRHLQERVKPTWRRVSYTGFMAFFKLTFKRAKKSRTRTGNDTMSVMVHGFPSYMQKIDGYGSYSFICAYKPTMTYTSQCPSNDLRYLHQRRSFYPIWGLICRLVGLFDGLHKNYWIDSNKTWWGHGITHYILTEKSFSHLCLS